MTHTNCIVLRHRCGGIFCLALGSSIWLLLCTYAVWRVYHPFMTSFNADDTMLVLQSAYHSILRDGVILWAVDRSAAFHLIIAHWLLETLRLKTLMPHAFYLLGQDIAFLLLCTAWLEHCRRTQLLASVLIALVLIAPNDFNPWIVRIGTSYPQMMLTALLAFTALLRYERRGGIGNALLLCLATAVAIISSPPTVLLVAVWCGWLVVCHWHDVRATWPRLCVALAALAAAYALAGVVRGLCDTTVHVARQTTAMKLAWAQWAPTLQRFAREFAGHGLLPSALMCAGMLLVAGLIPVAFVCVFVRRTWQVSSPLRCAMMLGSSACVYIFVCAANTWVHLNPLNPQYMVAPYVLFLAALVCLLDAVIVHLRRWVWLSMTACAMALLIVVTVVRAPTAPSAQYSKAATLAACAPALGGTVPLLGSYWVACESSFINPHMIVGSDFMGGVMAPIMLPMVLRNPVVLVNGTQAPSALAPNGVLPAAFIQQDCLLERTTDIPALAPHGWHAYRACQLANALIGNNLLVDKRCQYSGLVTLSNNILRMRAPYRDVAQVFWPLGSLPPGFYMLVLTARCHVKHGSPDALTAFYVMDYAIESPYPHLAFRAANLTKRKQTFSQVFYYPGASVPARVRLYTWCDVPLELQDIGLYPLSLPPEPRPDPGMPRQQ